MAPQATRIVEREPHFFSLLSSSKVSGSPTGRAVPFGIGTEVTIGNTRTMVTHYSDYVYVFSDGLWTQVRDELCV